MGDHKYLLNKDFSYYGDLIALENNVKEEKRKSLTKL